MTDAIPTVFIPALLCDEALYHPVIDRLGERIAAQVLLSPRPRLEESVTEILARAPERFVAVGTSYGGNLALALALAAPERVRALWLMGCSPAAAEPGGPDLAAALREAPDATIEMLAGIAVPAEASAAADAFRAMARRIGGAAGAAQATALMAREDVTPRLGGLHMPVLVLWGEADAIVPPAVGRALAEALPHAHFHGLPGCGHLPTLEKPAEAAALFAEFLDAELD